MPHQRSVTSILTSAGTDAVTEGFSAVNRFLTSAHDPDLLAALQRSNETVMITNASSSASSSSTSSSSSSSSGSDGGAASSSSSSAALPPAGSGIFRNVTESLLTYAELFARRYGGPHKSLVASFQIKCREYGDAKRAMAWRPLASVEKVQQPKETVKKGAQPKTWEILHLGPTQYYTFRQLWEQIEAFGAGLASLPSPLDANLKALPPLSQVGIYADTCKEWMISCYGLWTQQLVGVTVYANLGEDALLYAIKEAEMKAVVCTMKGAHTIAKVCGKASIKTPILIVMPDLLSSPRSSSGGGGNSPSPPANTTAFFWEAVVAEGARAIKAKTASATMPTSADDTALIMYTSGTTGDPKGVILTHGNIYACVQSFDFRLKQYLMSVRPEEGDPTYVGYLPLAHILEFGAENCFLMGGAMVGYGTPRTLTSATAKPHGDLEEFRPMFFVGVPRIFDTILKGVQAKIPKGLRGKLFAKAFEDRMRLYQQGVLVKGYDDSVFGATKSTIGGRCRCVVSGGAPLSKKTQEYMSVIFGCPVIQGYGLTETCAIATLPSYWDMRTEVIGPVLPGIEMRLVDVDTWRHNDCPNPRGEIWLRGPTVTKGYYKQEAKTKEAFTEDGWLKTGDVGEMMPGGTLRIIGRVKSLAKNLNGEYIAMESLESTYVQHELAVPNGVCVLVDSQKPFIAALVCTDEAKATAFAKRIAASAPTPLPQWPELLKSPYFQQKAAESMASMAARNGKRPFELVQKVLVVKDEWTPENGILTAAMKLKRTAIDKRYQKEIESLFAGADTSAAAVASTAKL